MVIKHQVPVLLLDCCHVCSFAHPQNQLGLPAVHGDVEAARVHSEWVDKLALADVAIHAESSFEAWINGGVLSPSAMRPTPKFIYRHN